MSDDLVVLVLTGGPKAGKTTALAAIEQEFGSLIEIVPESATKLLETLSEPPSEDNPILAGLFQQLIWQFQQYQETASIPRARRKRARIVLFDRGILDNAAYLPGGMEQFRRMTGITADQVYAKVDMVIHLETVAVSNPALFDNQGNPHRLEKDPSQAQDLDNKLQAIWRQHPDWRFFPGSNGIDWTVQQVLMLIRSLLNQEIERKWVIPALPAVVKDPDLLVNIEEIRQYYIAKSPMGEKRLRSINDQLFEETTKFGHGEARTEITVPISAEHFHAFESVPLGNSIAKRRYNIADGDRVLSVDLFGGYLEGHITVEREFANSKQARSYQPPSWMVELGAREVTEDKNYKNYSLAVLGLPQ